MFMLCEDFFPFLLYVGFCLLLFFFFNRRGRHSQPSVQRTCVMSIQCLCLRTGVLQLSARVLGSKVVLLGALKYNDDVLWL